MTPTRACGPGVVCSWTVLSALAIPPAVVAAVPDDSLTSRIFVEQFEAQAYRGGTLLAWDTAAYAGGSLHRLWLRADGEEDEATGLANRLELLGGRYLTPHVELLAGLRHDSGELPSRTYVTAGLQSPRDAAFHWEASAYLGDGSPQHADVHVGLRLQARYTWQLTPRWHLRARLEGEYWNEDHERFAAGTGSGPCELRGGLRLGYGVTEAMTWYAGVEGRYQVQDTAELTRIAGGDPNRVGVVAGMRLTF